MPALRNHRQERFCQLIKQGIPPYRAYPMAGYKPDEGAPYRLSGNVRVKRRIAELTRGLAMKTRVTVETITAELDEAAALAKRVEQPGAAIQAIATKAKLHGLLIDRKETGQPGDFQAAKTAEDVLAAVRAELGEAAAQALAAMVGQALPETKPALPELDQAERPADSELN
jgi:hypothetical protein